MGRRRNRRVSGLSLLFAIDKPYGMVTRKLDNCAAKVLRDDGIGHVGTLDPAVTGVVVLAVGQAKRLIPLMEEGKQKRYVARIRFGAETQTDDAEGSVVRSAEVGPELYDLSFAQGVVESFAGKSMQRPPRFSAIKVNGVRAYDRARAGEEFELPERPIEVFESRLLGIDTADGLCWDCEFLVSPGTYVRSIARDMGRRTNSAAHLDSLRRTASGPVTAGDCIAYDKLHELGQEGVREAALDPTSVLGYPTYELTDQELSFAMNGRAIRARESGLSEGCLVSIVRGNMMYGVWRMQDGMLRSRTNCPDGIEGVRL